MTTQTTSTATLRNGATVLAHANGDAKKYANYTAAYKAACKVDNSLGVFQSPISTVFFVRMMPKPK